MKRELTDARFVNTASNHFFDVGSARVGTGAKTGRGYNAGFISARCVLGLSVGIVTATAPMYLSEASPGARDRLGLAAQLNLDADAVGRWRRALAPRALRARIGVLVRLGRRQVRLDGVAAGARAILRVSTQATAAGHANLC